MGGVVGAFYNGKLVAGILYINFKNTCYYKFNASLPEFLHTRPNNHLIAYLISYLDKIGIDKLNLGYTGSSTTYDGLRKFKLSSGAKEYKRFLWKAGNWSMINTEFIESINSKVKSFIAKEQSFDDINNFSLKYYKYFI